MEVNIPEIGKCFFLSNKRSKRIIARYRNDSFYISYPSYLTVEEVLIEIERMKTRLIVLKQVNQPFIFNTDTIFETPHFSVYIQVNNLNKSYTSYNSNKLIFSFNKEINILADSTQRLIKEKIEKVCKAQAKTYISKRLWELANKHSFVYKSLKINKSRGRWGSCSSSGNINISLYCMMLPLHLLDLVLLHELCHTVEMNHDTAFWQLLDKATDGKCKQLTKELKGIKLKW